jgi:hypothetical protein
VIKRLDRITTVIILAITIVYLVTAMGFPGSAKIVPAIFGGGALVVVVIQLLSSRIRAFKTLSGELEVSDARDLDLFRDPAARRRLLLIGASLLAIPLLIAVFGLPLALPLYVGGLLLIQRQKIYIVIACTALIGATSYGLLIQLLAWPWNDGELWWLLR